MQPNKEHGTKTASASKTNTAAARSSILDAIDDINTKSHDSSTIVGACMVYFSRQGEKLTANRLANRDPSIPAIAHFCSEFLTSYLRKENAKEQ